MKTPMHRVDAILSDERDMVEEKSHVNQALTMNGYPEWLTNRIPTIQPGLSEALKKGDGDLNREVSHTKYEKYEG